MSCEKTVEALSHATALAQYFRDTHPGSLADHYAHILLSTLLREHTPRRPALKLPAEVQHVR